MRNALSAFLVLLICTYASSPISAASAPAHLRFAGADWRVLPTSEQGRVTVADHDGREALFVSRAEVWRDDLDLADGVLEFEVQATHESGFLGINFRDDGNGNLEQFYIQVAQAKQKSLTRNAFRMFFRRWSAHSFSIDSIRPDR